MSPDEKVFQDLELPPFLQDAIAELERLGLLRKFTMFSLAMAVRLPDLLEAMRSLAPQAGEAIDSFKVDVNEMRPFAAQELGSGMSYLNSLMVVRLLTVVETVVADAVVWVLQTRPDLMTRTGVRKIEGPLVDFVAASEGERAEFLASALAQETRAPLKVGVGRFEVLLEVVDLGGEVKAPGRRAMLELVEVRNIVVHRNGRADAKFLERCPWIEASVGRQLVIKDEMLRRYATAATYYVLELVRRWVRLQGHDALASGNYAEIYHKVLAELAGSSDGA